MVEASVESVAEALYRAVASTKSNPWRHARPDRVGQYSQLAAAALDALSNGSGSGDLMQLVGTMDQGEFRSQVRAMAGRNGKEVRARQLQCQAIMTAADASGLKIDASGFLVALAADRAQQKILFPEDYDQYSREAVGWMAPDHVRGLKQGFVDLCEPLRAARFANSVLVEETLLNARPYGRDTSGRDPVVSEDAQSALDTLRAEARPVIGDLGMSPRRRPQLKAAAAEVNTYLDHLEPAVRRAEEALNARLDQIRDLALIQAGGVAARRQGGQERTRGAFFGEPTQAVEHGVSRLGMGPRVNGRPTDTRPRGGGRLGGLPDGRT